MAQRDGPGPVGIVGAGQLARMLCEAASPLDVPTVVLAEAMTDAAVATATEVVPGVPGSFEDLVSLASGAAVVTFDHEQVDLALLRRLEADGKAVRPSAEALTLAVNKATMRERLDRAGVAVPAYEVLGHKGASWQDGVRPALEAFGEAHRWPLVLKAARGGYDGRGVWVVSDVGAAEGVWRRAEETSTVLLVEEHVAIEEELAVQVAVGPSGELKAWPAVETVQRDGVCREVLCGSLPEPVARAAVEVALSVARMSGVVGTLAVELFSSAGRLLVNELAMRPHNSGHWSIEGAVTSQFENHLRAVLGLPLGSTEALGPAVASVNVFGNQAADNPAHHLGDALSVSGAHVHLYGKAPRPGRKLGHVTVVGDDLAEVRRRAWRAAELLGTPVTEELGRR
jgi:5-(carboxyamino)imidazole ribonucleotide synthase